MRIEADRLERALILDTERQSEMSVVRNEYEIGENDPAQALRKAVVGAAIQAHPYHWDTIGYRSDIEGVTTEKLREHYRDVLPSEQRRGDPRRRLRRRQRAGALRPRVRRVSQGSPQPIPQVITIEPPQEGERRVVVKRPGNVGLVAARLHAARRARIPTSSRSRCSPSVLGDGVNARLYQALVEKRPRDVGERRQLRAARSVSAARRRDAARRARAHDEVEAALKAALADGRRQGRHRRRSSSARSSRSRWRSCACATARTASRRRWARRSPRPTGNGS